MHYGFHLWVGRADGDGGGQCWQVSRYVTSRFNFNSTVFLVINNTPPLFFPLFLLLTITQLVSLYLFLYIGWFLSIPIASGVLFFTIFMYLHYLILCVCMCASMHHTRREENSNLSFLCLHMSMHEARSTYVTSISLTTCVGVEAFYLPSYF